MGGKTTGTARGLVRTVVYLHPDERKALKMAAVERKVAASEIIAGSAAAVPQAIEQLNRN